MKASAYEFSEYVEKEIENLPADVFRSKSTPEAKLLIEEYQPLSKLALSLKTPGLSIEIETTEEGDEADGIIIESGFRQRELSIQITYAYSYEESLRMELLNKNGHTPMAGSIKRDKASKKIKAQLEAVNTNEYLERVANDILELYNKKRDKNYKTKMVLLIAFCEIKLCGLYSWSIVYELIRKSLENSSEYFISVYLYNSSSNEIYKAA